MGRREDDGMEPMTVGQITSAVDGVWLNPSLIKTAAGGVFVINEKLLSAYTVITTGMISPISAFVRSLNSLVNAAMLTPC
jgi:hypothetical protein